MGYSVIGSDIAGFSGDSIPARLYIRWAQFSTFCGLFLNGGHGERTLWKRSPQEFEIIRRFSWLHTELVPYMYSYVVSAHCGGTRLQRPVDGKYHYLFGDNLLVAPIYKDELENEIHLPEGQWRYWFDDKEVITGSQTFTKKFPLEEFPLYIKEGAIIPLNVQRTYTGIGDSTSANYLTWLIYPKGKSEFTVYDTKDQTPTTLIVEQQGDEIHLRFKGKKVTSLFRIHSAVRPKKVLVDGVEKTFQYDAKKQRLTLKQELNEAKSK
jgi:alpha-glucosidase (family GH31 glycosyl hydrolase)